MSGSGLWYCETFWKFPTWVEPEQKVVKFLPSCTQPRGKVYVQTNGTDRKRIVRSGPFGISTQQITTTPNGDAHSQKNWVPEIHFIHLP